jgi:hypothetical protein
MALPSAKRAAGGTEPEAGRFRPVANVEWLLESERGKGDNLADGALEEIVSRT